MRMNWFGKLLFTCIGLLTLVSLSYAASAVDQGAPGHQGPWPMYIQLLPDGGGGGSSGVQWVDAGPSYPGAITPNPGAAVVLSRNLQIGNVSSTIMLDTRADLQGEPSMDLRTRYPDGGCFWYEPFSYINTGGIVEFNQVACDGSTEQTKAEFDPVGGFSFLVSTNFTSGLTTDSIFSFTASEPIIRYNSTPNQTQVSAFHNDQNTPAILLQSEYPSASGGCGLYQDLNGHNANEWRCTGWETVDGGEPVATQSQVYWVDAGSNGAIANNNSGPVRIGTTSNLGGATLQIKGTGASHNVYQQWSDGTNSYELKGSGSAMEWISDTDIALNISPNNTSNYQFFAANALFFAPLNMESQKITSLAAATATTDAARFGQVQETVSISGATLPGLTAANNLVIGSMTSNSSIGASLTRASISITCLVAGVGAGNTAVNINDATSTSGNPQVSVTEACACTPGVVTNASVTGLAKTDTDQFNLALKSTAATDCATYPLFIVSGQVTLR